ncbi:MAG TPA: hypothetical protein VHV52_13885, partial [Gaiellaceae bacterium]|nr:hypothetical protein [Gaiellaceae bacterium]
SWAVRRLLECVAQRRPVVAVLDDLHWGSPPIHDLARQLGEAADVPLLTIVTARETPAGSTADVTELRPLDALACTAVVAALLDGTPADPATVDELVRASGGNPLFLEELVLSLRAGDAGPPRPLESLLAARLARLRTDVRGTVCCASVLGRSFSLDALSNLVEGAIEDTVGHAVAEGILQPTRFEDEDLEFRHLMMRDAAYASLPLARRAELHERHAQWRDRSPGIPPLESEALVVYHLDQAFRARQTLAPASASLADDARTIAARGTALGRMLLARGDAADAAALLARAHELTGDDATAVDLGRAQLDVGDFAAAERAFAAAEGPRARLGLVDVRFRVEPSADLAAAAAEIAAVRTELERAHDDTGLTEALLAAAYLAVVRGDAAALAAALEEALAVARRAGRSRAETWILFLLCSACWYGPLPVPDGLERCELILAEGAGRPGVEAAALQSLAVLHALDGAFGKARRRVAESRGLRRELGQRIGAAASAIDDGIVELLAGDPAAAARTLREGTAELERLGEQAYFSTAATLLGEALVSLGELDEAQRVAHAAADAAADDDVASQVGWRAVLARCGGADAEPLAREAVARADATDFLLLRAEAWAALADATGDERARERAHSALAEKRCAPAAIAHWTRAGL